MQADINDKLILNWKYFSIEQINSHKGSQWKIWEQPEDYQSRSLHAFWAAEAARQQGKSSFHSFHIALLKAKHEQKRDIADLNTLIEVADYANLNTEKFRTDLSNRALLTKLDKDHSFAVEELNIFGTPTLVFSENQAVFLKMSSPPSPEESLPIFNEIFNIAHRRRIIREIKRP